MEIFHQKISTAVFSFFFHFIPHPFGKFSADFLLSSSTQQREQRTNFLKLEVCSFEQQQKLEMKKIPTTQNSEEEHKVQSMADEQQIVYF